MDEFRRFLSMEHNLALFVPIEFLCSGSFWAEDVIEKKDDSLFICALDIFKFIYYECRRS